MSVTKRDLVEDLEPFTDDIRIVVRDAQGNLVAVKGTGYEIHPVLDEGVLVLEIANAKRGKRT
jgi:hypothetical protein